MRAFFRDPVGAGAFALLVLIVLVCVFAPLLTSVDPRVQDLTQRLLPPSGEHWLGTDEFGRDLFARILYGGRLSLLIGAVSVTIGLVVGGTLGLVAAFYSKLDGLIMRVMDVLLSFPRLLLAIAIVAALGPGLSKAMLAVGIGTIPIFARLMRSTVITVRELDYVAAARVHGASDRRILSKYVVPNSMTPVTVYATLNFGQAVLIAAILSFLGFGVQPPSPEWGAIVNAGRSYLQAAPHLTMVPGMAIFLVVFCLNVLGDRLRDFLDPRLRHV